MKWPWKMGDANVENSHLSSIFMIFDVLFFWKLTKEGMEAILKREKKKNNNTRHSNHVSFSLYITNAVSRLGVNSNKNQSIKECFESSEKGVSHSISTKHKCCEYDSLFIV